MLQQQTFALREIAYTQDVGVPINIHLTLHVRNDMQLSKSKGFRKLYQTMLLTNHTRGCTEYMPYVNCRNKDPM